MKKILGILAMGLAIAACSRMRETEIPVLENGGDITITATLAPKAPVTRAVADNADGKITVTWAVNEHIAILYEVSSVKELADATITSVDGGTGAATISFTVDGGTSDHTPCTLVYPLAAAKADFSGVKTYAEFLSLQDGTLNANLDVRVGEGTIHISPASLNVTTQPEAQFAIFKFTLEDKSSEAINATGFTVQEGDALITSVTPASATNSIYVAIPPAVAGTTFKFTATDGSRAYAQSIASTAAIEKGYYYQTTLAMPKDALPGLFTINGSGGKVRFSPGNLQATTADKGVSWTWNFAENQWDCVGNVAANNVINGNGTVSANGKVDLFGWVGASSTVLTAGAAQYGISNSTESDDYGTDAGETLKSDWGNTMKSGWRTPTKDEWVYLLSTRGGGNVNSTANARYTFATINTNTTGVNGLILFPDGVTIAAAEASSWGAINGYSNWGTKCTAAQWTALATKGCVFLPAAGYGNREPESVQAVGIYGYYLSSSSEDASNAYFVSFEGEYPGEDVVPANWGSRYFGRSVRLVSDVN